MVTSFAAPVNLYTTVPRELELPSMPTSYTAYRDVEAEAAFKIMHALPIAIDRSNDVSIGHDLFLKTIRAAMQ